MARVILKKVTKKFKEIVAMDVYSNMAFGLKMRKYSNLVIRYLVFNMALPGIWKEQAPGFGESITGKILPAHG